MDSDVIRHAKVRKTCSCDVHHSSLKLIEEESQLTEEDGENRLNLQPSSTGQFFVRTYENGQSIKVSARLQDTVESLLEKSSCKLHSYSRTVEDFLVYEDKLLQGNKTLGQCGVPNGATLYLITTFRPSLECRGTEGLVEHGIVLPAFNLLSKRHWEEVQNFSVGCRQRSHHASTCRAEGCSTELIISLPDVDASLALLAQIKRSTAKFILMQPKGAAAAKHLEIFRSNGACRAFVGLLLSDVSQSRDCGADCIRMFTNPEAALHIFQDWFGPILLDISALLRFHVPAAVLYETQSLIGATYRACRQAVSRLLERHHAGLLQDVFGKLGVGPEILSEALIPFVHESVLQLQKGLSDTATSFVSGVEAENSCPLSADDAECFANIIGPCCSSIVESAPGCSVNSLNSCEVLLTGLLGSLDSCLKNVFEFAVSELLAAGKDGSYHSAIQKIPGCMRGVVSIILRGMNVVQDILQSSCTRRKEQGCLYLPNSSFRQEFAEFLKRQKSTINAYLCRSRFCAGGDLSWFLKKRELLEFETKERWFRQLLPKASEDFRDRQEVIVGRGSNVLGEAFEQVSYADPRVLRNGIMVQFADEGATGQGVIREFFAMLGQEIFNPNLALFRPCPHDRQRFSPNPASRINPGYLSYFKFCGRLIALALVHDVQIDARFSTSFFKQLAQRETTLKDLAEVDPALHSSCQKILEVPSDEVEDLALTFVTTVDELGTHMEVELVPGGADRHVTADNREEFIGLLVKRLLMDAVESQVGAFVEGFQELLTDNVTLKQLLDPLEPEDLEIMLYGEDRDVSLADWQAHTIYHDYTKQDLQIQWFWQVVTEMTPQHRRKLLYFATAIWNLPSCGFAGLHSRFHIFRANVDCNRLPTAHTCFHQLLLPPYPTLAVLRGKLEAVTEDHIVWGFGFL